MKIQHLCCSMIYSLRAILLHVVTFISNVCLCFECHCILISGQHSMSHACKGKSYEISHFKQLKDKSNATVSYLVLENNICLHKDLQTALLPRFCHCFTVFRPTLKIPSQLLPYFDVTFKKSKLLTAFNFQFIRAFLLFLEYLPRSFRHCIYMVVTTDCVSLDTKIFSIHCTRAIQQSDFLHFLQYHLCHLCHLCPVRVYIFTCFLQYSEPSRCTMLNFCAVVPNF